MKPEERKTPKGIIRAARRAMESDFKIWGQGANAGLGFVSDHPDEHEIANSCGPNSKKAVCWCAQGLLIKCDGRHSQGYGVASDDVVDPVERAREELYPGDFEYIELNDGECHKTWRGAYDAIIRVFKRAEELA